ncbi:MAG: hypothetical protein JW751_00855 [Polyangiaceae bacterium]|nr:hypothetical protein [Polyangiaceae bacterium]
MRKLTVLLSLIFALALLLGGVTGQGAEPKAQKTIGIVCDRGGAQVILFDADADVVMGSIKIPPLTPYSLIVGCAIAPDGKLAFVSDFEDRVWVVDLTADPPALATGKNPIPVSTWAVQMVFSPDGKYLIVSDGYSTPEVPLSVVDLATRTEVDAFLLGKDISPTSVAVSPDGSVLVVGGAWKSGETTTIRRLRLDRFGDLTDTGESIPNSEAHSVGNVLCATKQFGGVEKSVGVFLCRRGVPQMGTLDLDGLRILATATGTGAFAVDGVLNAKDNFLYVRTNESPNTGPSGPGIAFIDVFHLDVLLGRIGPRRCTIPLDRRVATYFGGNQMALHPNGKKLYVSGLGLPELRVFHASSGHFLKTIELPTLDKPTAITVGRP